MRTIAVLLALCGATECSAQYFYYRNPRAAAEYYARYDDDVVYVDRDALDDAIRDYAREQQLNREAADWHVMRQERALNRIADAIEDANYESAFRGSVLWDRPSAVAVPSATYFQEPPDAALNARIALARERSQEAAWKNHDTRSPQDASFDEFLIKFDDERKVEQQVGEAARIAAEAAAAAQRPTPTQERAMYLREQRLRRLGR